MLTLSIRKSILREIKNKQITMGARDIIFAIIGLVVGTVLGKLCWSLTVSSQYNRGNRGKRENIGKLASFLNNQVGEKFYVETVAKNAGVCQLRHIESRQSRWYKIPLIDENHKVLKSGTIYVLSKTPYDMFMLS